MKVNKLLFCLLFLMLGTTTAWADKYYQPGSYKGEITPRLTLEQAVGKKFMIYNTAINGDEDRTGFLRNGGVSFEHDKSKERDLYVYNESFVYTMEAYDDNADGVNDWYAIKSVNTGLYVNAAGRTDILKATDAKLIITSWDEATTGKSGVNMESWKYSVVANGDITSGGHGSTVFVVKNYNGGNNPYWNGNPDAFVTYSNGHPYAFYEAHEVTGGDYLQDLHIYSRSDIYSAQVIYGYIKGASQQITANPSFVGEGGFENLIDGDATTYNVTNWQNNVAGHYYQIDLGEKPESIYLYMQRRADGKNAPVNFELQACATAGGTYTKIGDYTTELASKAIYTSPKISLNGSYQHLRIVARETTTQGYNCMGLSELYVLPGTPAMGDVLDFVNLSAADPIYKKATAKEYTRLVEKYDSLYPDAKLISGVPLPGNKYRIYADAYDVTKHVYVNREVKANADGTTLDIMASGSYHSATTDQEQYEWYCEQNSNGLLVFRNVANPDKYLGNGAVVDEPYEWSMSTLGTQRHGVPLRNHAQQYLAVYNDGTLWMGNVREIQNQTVTNASIDHDNNAETAPVIVEKGLCTDFVFIPVPTIGDEKKITITANDLVERNTRLLFDSNGDGTDEVHPLPFSRMFVDATNFENLELHLLCNDVHAYQGVKVNGVLNDAVDERTGNVISFKFDAVNNGDILEIQLDIEKPFEVMSAEFETTETPHLYLIRNKHQLGLPQQARPNRADVNIGIDDEEDAPISSQTGKRYYARFNNRGADMDLVEGTEDWTKTNFDANSLFYFTETEDKDYTEYYCVDIHNATTVMKCADQAKWDTQGNTWFVQPKKITNNYGYNIGRTILNANNNPGKVLGCNHEDGDKVSMYKTGSDGKPVEIKANDDGTAWEFIPVDDATAKKLLYEFIDSVANELYDTIDYKMKNLPGIDETKAGYYLQIVEMMHDRAAYFKDPASYSGSFSDVTSNPVAKLLQFAQNIHMLEHEIEYALYELPELSQDVVGRLSELGNSDQPHWYYIRNVKSNNYAGYVDTDAQMTLGQFPENQPQLKNLFYLVGEKNSYAPVMDNDPTNDGLYHDFPGNNLIVDEYLKAHVHTFMAKDLTLVSKNVEVPMNNVNMNPGAGKQTVANVNLKHDEDWRVEIEYDLTGHTQYNAYGSALLASTGDPLADSYYGAFQVYFKDDHSIVIKCNNANDQYQFYHTQNYCSHIKVVITYSQHVVTMDVYNSIGVKETKHVSGVTLNDISLLTTALPADGVTLTKLNAYQVEEMTWKTHQQLQEEGENKDDWYILPSSNTAYTGLAIVLEDPNDNMMGWANGEGQGTYITTDLGTADNSTWKFERVIEFDAHVDELLEMYDYKDCVIYDKDIARLYALIKEKSTFIKEHENDPDEEAAFNELYYAFLNYKGRTAAELQAPKPGSLYTIRPMVEENTGNALLVHVDKSNGTYATKEVYNGGVVRAGEDEKSYDPRGVWVFEGNAGADGFLALENLKVKNLHTQCYLTALGDAASAVNEADAAQVALGTIGGCITKFKVGEKFMNRTTVTPTLSYDRTLDFWGDAVTTYPSELNNSINTGKTEENIPSTEGDVRCKRLDVEVETEGNVVVTFKFEEGSHKINILGVELLGNDGKKVYADYHYGRAGGDHVNNVYTINGVVAGAYTMNCYVFEPDGGDDLTEHKGYFTIDGVATYSGEGKIINTGTEATKWIVEEILNPEESVYYETSTNTNGHSTLMLGFPTLIPDEVEAFHGVSDGDILDGRYISMVSYGEPGETRILPANAPVILRNTDQSIEPKTVKFYYRDSNAVAVADKYIFGHLYFTLVNCSSFDDIDNDGIDDRDVDIYMLNKNGTTTRMYRTYENYNSEGVKESINGSTNHFEGGYVTCKANKAFMVLSKETSLSVSSLAFTFTIGGTTSVDDVETELGELEIIETIYDLQGRRLSEITQPGIYIVNGKKVFVK